MAPRQRKGATRQRRRGNEELRRSERPYRSLFENTRVGLADRRLLLENGRPADPPYLGVNAALGTLPRPQLSLDFLVIDALPAVGRGAQP